MKIDSPESVGMSSGRMARIEPGIQKWIDQRVIGGATLMVNRRGKTVYFNALGEQDRERGVPMPADGLFRIYSMTKPIICTALMMLFEEGKFQLSHPVSKYLPEFKKMTVAEKAGDCLLYTSPSPRDS